MLEKAREVPERKAIGIDRNVGIAAQLGTEVGMVGVVHGRRAARTEKATVPLQRQALRQGRGRVVRERSAFPAQCPKQNPRRETPGGRKKSDEKDNEKDGERRTR